MTPRACLPGQCPSEHLIPISSHPAGQTLEKSKQGHQLGDQVLDLVKKPIYYSEWLPVSIGWEGRVRVGRAEEACSGMAVEPWSPTLGRPHLLGPECAQRNPLASFQLWFLKRQPDLGKTWALESKGPKLESGSVTLGSHELNLCSSLVNGGCCENETRYIRDALSLTRSLTYL